MLKSRLAVILLILLTLGGCATARKWDGKDPNFQLTNEAARQELDNYTFREEGIFSQYEGFKMGPQERLYSLSSLEPMMKRVTPATSESVATIQRGLKLNKIVGWTSLAFLVAGSMLQDDLQVMLLGAGGFGAAWWAGRNTWLRWQLTKIGPAYNDELESRFAPRFSWIKQF